MEASKVADLKHFVDSCRSNPSILHDPSLGFLKTYLLSLGGRIPPEPKQTSKDRSYGDRKDDVHTKKEPEDDDVEDEIIESDVELEGEVVDADNDPPQEMGDPNEEVSDDRREAAQSCKAKALDALSEDKLEEAIEHLTEAILLNPVSAILLSTRASVYLKMKKPNAAIRDADAALQINPDSAKGYKTRGMARAMLGHWEEAARDLHVASRLDFDEELASILKKVEPNAHRIEDHRRKYERLRRERDTRKAERERQHRRDEQSRKEQRRQSEAQKGEPYESGDPVFKRGTVIGIHSPDEYETKMKVASNLSRLVILYFTATWCGPCRYMGPVYTSLAGKHPDVVFLKVDIDELSSVAQRWDVSSVPTFYFVKGGKEIDKVVGADKSGLERKIESHARSS